MPTNVNKNSASATGAKLTNTINVKVVVGDVKKKKPRRKAAPSTSADSPPPPPPSTIVQNYMQPSGPQPPANSYPEPTPPRSGASMFNRPYDVANAAVGTENEAVPEGLASNFDAFRDARARYFMSLQEQMEELIETDGTDQTQPPPSAQDVPLHGAQEDAYTVQYPDEDPPPHRSATFALPPTLALTAPPTQDTVETATPSALPGPSRGRSRSRRPPPPPSNRRQKAAMIADGVISASQYATDYRRTAYERWVTEGRDPNSKPDFRYEDS